jgi:hypothetical protein
MIQSGRADASRLGRGLSLKGVLLRVHPIAIIEDAQGKAWICGIGDSAAGAIVRKITADHVEVSDAHGSWILITKE